METNWLLKGERRRDSWKGDQGEKNNASIPPKLRLQPQKPLHCNSTPEVPEAAAQWLAFWLSGLLLTGTVPLFDVAHCLASGTEVILLSKGMTYPSRCHYSYSGIHRDISLIGHVFYGVFLVPCSFSEGYKLVEPCFYFFHHLKAIPFFFLIYRLSLAQNKCSINICWIDFPVWLCGRKTLLLYMHNSFVWLLLNSFLTLGYVSGSAAESCLSQQNKCNPKTE